MLFLKVGLLSVGSCYELEGSEVLNVHPKSRHGYVRSSVLEIALP